MTLKALDNLVAIGKLKPELPDRQEFDGMLRSARRSLQDVQVEGISEAGRFTFAYGAAHALAEMVKRTTKPRISDAEKLKNLIQLKIGPMVERNRTRQDLQEKFQSLIDEYNNGAFTAEQFFEALKQFIDELDEEERRGVREGLNEEELAIFDLLFQGVELSEKEREQVKTIAQQLLEKIRDDLVIDWRKKQQAKARVRDHIQAVLDYLPESYDEVKWNYVFDSVYQHVYQAYRGQGERVYH